MTNSNGLNDQRIVSLDVIRGFALLGILLMNIQSFSMVGQAYLNPLAYGEFTGLNNWTWVVSHVFADQKFMSIFSMLFGASILMISANIEAKGGTAWRIHYRRNFWLLVIGLIHAYGLWYGDILTPYAVCSFLIYPMRKLSIKTLMVIGVLVFSVASFIETFIGWSMPQWPPEALRDLEASWMPTLRQVGAETTAYLGDFAGQLQQRFKTTLMMHTTVFLTIFFWRISGLMLIGMALYKLQFFQGKWSEKNYMITFFMTAMPGFLVVIFGLLRNQEENWALEYSMFLGSQWNYWGSLLVALAYVALINLILKKGLWSLLTIRLSAVGRMALSNYLFQTILCTFLFYGHGLGWFGQVERQYQLLIVIVVWLLQLTYSPWWLTKFKMGPFEWAWRSLTYWKLQEFIKL